MTPSSPPFSSLARDAAWPALLCLLLGAPGCGGDSTPAPATAHTESTKTARDEPAASESNEAEDAPAPRTLCDDGTCFECGSGTCPEGWYCDENAKGGAACSWLPECGKKLDCACIGKALGSGCSCAETDGGLHVKCK